MAYTVLDSKNIDKKKNIYTFGGSGTKPERADIAENSKLIDYSSGEKFYYDPTKAAGSKWQPDKEPSGGGSGGSLPDNFPEEGEANANKFVGFDANGDYTAKDAPEEIPSITGKNGKVLGVTLDAQEHEQTEWVNPPASYPTITGKNGKVLGVTLDISDNEQVEWVDKDNRFTATFTDTQGTWECDKTISEILAAYQAGKLCECVAELAQDTYALGILSNANTVAGLVVFSLIVSLDGMTRIALFFGSIDIDNETDLWTALMNDTVPACTADDIGKVLGVVSDGDGGAMLDWVTPQ